MIYILNFNNSRELSDIACLVGQLFVEFALAAPHRLGKGLVQVLYHFLAPTHQLSQVGKIVLHVPAVGPAIVLVVGIASTYSAPKAIVEVGQKLTVLVLRVEEAGFGIPHRQIVISLRAVFPCILVSPYETGNAREAPLVVGGAQRDSHRLPFLEARDIGVGLLLAFAQGWDIAMFLVEAVNPSCGLSAPGGQRLLLDEAVTTGDILIVGINGICQAAEGAADTLGSSDIPFTVHQRLRAFLAEQDGILPVLLENTVGIRDTVAVYPEVAHLLPAVKDRAAFFCCINSLKQTVDRMVHRDEGICPDTMPFGFYTVKQGHMRRKGHRTCGFVCAIQMVMVLPVS